MSELVRKAAEKGALLLKSELIAKCDKIAEAIKSQTGILDEETRQFKYTINCAITIGIDLDKADEYDVYARANWSTKNNLRSSTATVSTHPQLGIDDQEPESEEKEK